MNVVEFNAQHIDLLLQQGGREWFGEAPFSDPEYAIAIEAAGNGWSLIDGGHLIGCGGIAKEHDSCGTAWTLLTPLSGPYMTRIHRFAMKTLARCPLVRVQAHVSPTFEPAQHWIEMLGFQLEGRLRKFTQRGRDMLLYARVH